MDTLSLEQKLQIFEYLDISSLMSAADTCKDWRNAATKAHFLEKQCQRRFGLSFGQLPPLAPCEELLINTQRLVFQAAQPVFLDGDESLLKIYAMEMRASWYPFAFLESYIGENVALRLLAYPWPYDSGDQYREDTAFFRDTKKFSARIHAAFPHLLEALVGKAMDEARFPPRLSYYTSDYSALSDTLWLHETLAVQDRLPRVIELETNQGSALRFFIYDDNDTFHLVYTPEVALPGLQMFSVSPSIALNASLQEMRGAAEDTIRRFCQCRHTPPTTTCPPYLTLEWSRVDYHEFQVELTKVLSSVVITAAYDLGKELSSMEADPDQRQLLFQKLIRFVDGLYPCAVVDHEDCEKSRKAQSKRLNIALNRALRRLVNDTFTAEVKRWYADPTTRQLVHTWSWLGKGRSNYVVCFDSNCPRNYSKRKCCMKVAVASSCCHRAYPEVWPAVTLKKAIDRAPRLMKALEEDVMGYVSRCSNR